MRPRHAIVILLCLFTLFLGVFIYLDENTRGIPSDPAKARDSSATQTGSQVSNFLTSLTSKSVPLWQNLSEKRDVIFYGALALFGVLITALAIRYLKKVAREESESRKEKLLEDLVQEKDKAENLAKLKSGFLHQVSHDLRTPLAVIMGYLECMIDGLYGQIDPQHKEILEVVSKQSKELNSMIEQILTFSRLEEGRNHIRIEDFSVSNIVSDLKDTYDFLGGQKGIKVIWDIGEEVPNLRSDPGKVKVILNNLLQNAVKFTDHGSVSARIRYLPGADSIVLEVADTGIGIPHDSLATIFDPFVQVNRGPSERWKGGIGLGLSIVNKHVEQLKGTIDVESEPGKGTTFMITLPRVHQEERAQDEP